MKRYVGKVVADGIQTPELIFDGVRGGPERPVKVMAKRGGGSVFGEKRPEIAEISDVTVISYEKRVVVDKPRS